MSKRVLLCLSHAVEEYQQLDLLSSLGYEVASIGGYIDPRNPHTDTRPPLDIPYHPEVHAAVDALGTDDNLGAAQSRIPDAILDWLGDDGIVIYHHYLERLYGQWPRVKDWMRGSPERRVIWRSVGQSVENNERMAQPYRVSGLERIAYSPKEANIPGYSGHDALIRFWGEASDRPWTGHRETVVQFTQHLRQRDPYTNWTFWDTASRGLPRMAAGPGSEDIGGPGKMPAEQMTEWLHAARAYLYTGTQPASYTLGLIEAMHAGTPVVSIGPSWMKVFDYGPRLFEGHELALFGYDDPNDAHHRLRELLNDADYAATVSCDTRQRARELFDRDTIGAQWKAFLG